MDDSHEIGDGPIEKITGSEEAQFPSDAAYPAAGWYRFGSPTCPQCGAFGEPIVVAELFANLIACQGGTFSLNLLSGFDEDSELVVESDGSTRLICGECFTEWRSVVSSADGSPVRCRQIIELQVVNGKVIPRSESETRDCDGEVK